MPAHKKDVVLHRARNSSDKKPRPAAAAGESSCRYNGAATRDGLMTIATTTLDELKRRAREASQCAYAPYSGFPVGAAILASNGEMYAGANVENASFGLTVCAERNAIFQAVAQGMRRIEVVVVYTPTPAAAAPCGACRQVIHEFGSDALIICCTDDATAERRYTLAELLPGAFGPDHLAGRR
jgi:cytidine deaminase